MYVVRLSPDAQKHIALLTKKAPATLKKLAKLMEELREHPRSGTGQCEQLKHYKQETWSRRINREYRLVYRIYDDIVEVLVISAYGHYEDK